MRFTVATYNIHKGFTHFARRMVIHEVRERLHGLSADILFLQEVIGTHDRHAFRYNEWPGKPQHEFIADAMWREVAYGKNAVYRHGHHGNAVLSRYPIVGQENQDISAHVFESRGLLHCEIKLGPRQPLLHCVNVHLGLFERGRQWQIRALVERIKDTVPGTAPLIIAGDFNDWRRKGDRTLTEELLLSEVFEEVKGRPARTFPSVLPVFRLDRIYVRGLNVVDARVHYAFPSKRMSDHAALAATFELPLRRPPRTP
jgi:endonuclease/exonuclease/phosphatase family metal-dependent hydrolase